MAGAAHVQVTLGAASGFAEDAIVNTFNFIVGDTVEASAVDLANAVEGFYLATVNPTNADPLAEYLSPHISRLTNACTVDVYDVSTVLGGLPHGSPVYSETFTMSAPASVNPVPSEVALAITLRATGWALAPVEAPDGADDFNAPDRPRARHTGKIYVGPFTTPMLLDVSGVSRPQPMLITRLLDSVEHVQIRALADADARLAVWSRADQLMRGVTDAQVDNAWDTQRRRGQDSTSRTTRAIPQV